MGGRKELVVLIHVPYRLTKYDASPGHRRTECIPDYLMYCLTLHLLVTLDHFEPMICPILNLISGEGLVLPMTSKLKA
jgi:hypothetical protein